MKEKFIAKIVNNIDVDQEGKVQIYIPHLMEGFLPTHYPWAKQDREWSSFIPEIGEYVWVWFEDEELYRKPYYQNKVTLKDYNDHNETIGSMTDIYPNVKYIKLKNGVSFAISSLLTEASLKIGNAEIYISPLGEVTIKGLTINVSDITGVIKFNLLTHMHNTPVGPTIGTPIIGS